MFSYAAIHSILCFRFCCCSRFQFVDMPCPSLCACSACRLIGFGDLLQWDCARELCTHHVWPMKLLRWHTAVKKNETTSTFWIFFCLRRPWQKNVLNFHSGFLFPVVYAIIHLSDRKTDALFFLSLINDPLIADIDWTWCVHCLVLEMHRQKKNECQHIHNVLNCLRENENQHTALLKFHCAHGTA